MRELSGVSTMEGFPGCGPVPPILEKTILRVAIFIESPISSAVGSPSLWFSQPVAETMFPSAGVVIIIVDAIIQIVAWLTSKFACFCPGIPGSPGPEGAITMSLPDLAKFLSQLKNGTQVPVPETDMPQAVPRPGVQLTEPTWFTVFLLISGFVQREKSPRFSLFVPIISFRGITGGLPIIILGLIALILVRSVVPPSSSGIIPVPERAEPKFELKLNELLNLLKGYSRYFKP